ncbi:hypothetical protein MHI24_29665 [Paenibacillus sp. FSL K6-1096]|uniref:hypothetical protein n=1 Tax=Paenibacillus sp. FSL K6-1096 TaxID=2921460 RepID=UPI0030EC54AA
MFTLIAGTVLFLLAAAGIIAYQNSRILAAQKTDHSMVPAGKRMYSVYDQSFTPETELPEAVPLFQFTAAGGGTETARTLCRVTAGTGEMALSEAQHYMLGILRQAAIQGGGRLETAAFPDKAVYAGEKELIKALAAAAKEEAEHADHREQGSPVG